MSRLLTPDEAQYFKKILAEYKPDDAVLEQFKSSNFAVIAGPAGAGKDTLRNSLIAGYPEIYLPILSTTTRPPRDGEVDGQTYHFRTIEEVEQGLNRREFLQAALVHNQQVSCLHIDEVNKLNLQQCGLSILIAKTEADMRAYHPRLKTIFVIPPDKKTLLERINTQRMLDDAEIKRRLDAAKTELMQALESPHYYCLVSDTVEHITKVAHTYLKEDTRNEDEDSRARAIIREIVKSLNG